MLNSGMMTSICDEEGAAGNWARNANVVSGGTAASAVVELGRRLLGAARAGDTRAVLELMSRGAPFTTDWLGTSPLHLAAQHAHTDTCAVLLRAGMSRDTRTKVERTPLHLAAYEGHAAVVELLLTHGALVDPCDMLRMTPLHWAAQRGHIGVAEVLLRHGADLCARSKFGKTPLDLVANTELYTCFQRAALRPAPPPQPSSEMGEAQARISQSPSVPEAGSPPPPLRPSSQSDASDTDESAARLLRRHGITMLPDDDSGTVLTALQSGRTVVLSAAGKLMLKDSETSGAISPVPTSTPASRAGVLLTATPVTSPPRPGVKIFTLPHKLVTTRRTPLTKVKYVQLPADAKIVPANNGGGARRQAVLQLRPAVAPSPATTTPIKLLLHKNGPGRLSSAPSAPAAPATDSPANTQTQEGADASEIRRLRVELAAARATVARLRARLRRARAAHAPPSASPSPSPERRPHPHPPD